MKLTVLKTLLALVCVCLSGCALDSIDISEHTCQVSPSGTVTAKFTSSIIVASSGSTLLMDIERDSLHFAVGMPEGWEVTSVHYYVPLHYRPIKYFMQNGEIDTLEMMLAMQESLTVFESRKTAMGADNGMLTYFENRIISASDTAGNDTSINSDSIAEWAGYKGYIGLNIAAGSSLDTFMVGTASDSSTDTTCVSLIPVYVYVTLKAGSSGGVFPILYYQKTGEMPDSSDNSEIIVDGGDFTYFPVNVGGTSLERGILSTNGLKLSIDARPNPSNGTISFFYNSDVATQIKIEVFAINGALVRSLNSSIAAATGSVFWDGNDQRGFAVPRGTYMVRLSNGADKITRIIQMIR
jgi:hypothetical protein